MRWRNIKEGYLLILQVRKDWIMTCQLLVGVKRMELNIGLLEILGEVIGVKVATLD
jgi:hypothetical protein